MLWSLSSQGRQGIRISSIVCNKLRETTEPAFIFTWLHTIILFACHQQILHKHCLQFLLWVKMAPRETENNACAKFGSDEQRTLWYVMVFSRVVNWSTYLLLPFRRPCWLCRLFRQSIFREKPLAPRALRFLVTYKLSKVALGTRMWRIYFVFFSLALFPFSLSLYSQNEILAGFQQRDIFNL